MGADISRVRFDPLRDYAGVVLQQGRLLLDADFNDYVALLDRRLRAETSDLTSMGPDPNHAGVAWVPRQTPEGFHVTATGGVLSIGRGRMYVDGLQAENHGLPPAAFDTLLSEPTGSADTPYLAQPYWPTPDPVPDGTSLAYLDVWEREVTHLEAPELVEVAVAVDTTARWQTAWQVRLLPNVGNAACASDDKDIPGWLDVIEPSGGRLTTGTIDVAPTDDPCELPPTSGYRGRENQTYRVEIHAGGAPGIATFKWSRDNGSVATSVTEMVSPTVLRLASIGRDDVLRVSTGNWVEILDDHYELGQRPGVIRKVTVDDAARTITFSGALPADLQPASAADAAARHMRVRRWDQAGIIHDGAGAELTNLDAGGATGLITTPAAAATQVVLEDGVVVSFSVAAGGSGTFREGDHWIFAARTADTSIEILTEAPPVGVHHHYARLGFVALPDSDSDCRQLWPPQQTGGDGGCDCTVCVTPDSHSQGVLTIQAAIDQVKETGGTVCLATGVYDLGDGVFVDGARSVRIHGQGPATILVGRGTALTVTRSLAITVDSLAIVSGRGAPAGVRLRSVLLTNLRDLVVLSYGGEGDVGSAVELSGIAAVVGLENNVLVGRTAVDIGGNDKLGMVAAGLRVLDNVLVGFDRGVDLGGLAAYLFACRVQGNEVLSGEAGGVFATGAVAPGGSLEIVDNKVTTSGTGIAVGSDAIITGNVVNALPANHGSDGIVVTSGGFAAAAGNVTVLGNRVHDRTGTGIALRIPIRTFMVKQNIITSVSAGIAIEGHGAAERVAIDNNEVLDVLAEVEGLDSVVGISLTHAQSAAVVGNTVSRVAPKLVDGTLRAGILVEACADIRVAGNVVGEIGPPEGFIGLAAGIAVVGPFDHVSASENSVRFGADDTPPVQGQWHALMIESAGSGQVRYGAGNAVIATATGAFVLSKLWAYLVFARADHVGATSNQLSGGGDLPTCLVRVNGDVVADANQCSHVGGDEIGMLLGASSIIATSNRVRGGKSRLRLEVAENRFAAVANLTAGGVLLGSSGLSSPWDALNPIVG